MAPLPRRSQFVGRDSESRLLRHAFDAAADGAGGLALVTGEPGIGKTALCEHLAAYVRAQGGQVLAGHCYEEGSLSLPYLPVVEVLRAHVRTAAVEALRSQLGDGASEVARIVPELRSRLKVEPNPPGDPEHDRYRLLESVADFLAEIGGTAPLLLVLEDLHDADQGTLDLLVHLARRLGGMRLLVVGTYRDVEVARTHPLSGALAELRRVMSFERVQLQGLGSDHVRRLMGGLAAQDVSQALAEAVHRRTEGNPLFVQEVLRLLVDERARDEQDNRSRLTEADALAVGIPEGLRDVIGKRLSRLSPTCNRVLAVAAVIGREFDPDTLQTVAGVEEETLLTALEEAVRAAVIQEQARAGSVRYRFAHAFFRQTLYEELIAPRRLRLHQQVARALEAQHARRLDEHAAELAQHFSQSTDPADLEKAVTYGKRAAEHAAAVHAYGEAVRLLEQALAVQEVLDPDARAARCALLLALADALIPLSQLGRVVEELAPEALTLAEAVSDERLASRACILALMALRRAGGGSIGLDPTFGRWADLADRYALPASADRVYADISLALVRRVAENLAAARELHHRALALARTIEDPEAIHLAASAVLNVDDTPRHWEDRRAVAEQAAGWSRDGVSPRTLAVVLQRSGDVFLDWGDRERAETCWRQRQELGERTHDRFVQLVRLVDEAVLATVDGRLDDAVRGATLITERSTKLGNLLFGRHYTVLVAFRPLIHLGRFVEASQILADYEAVLAAGSWWIRVCSGLARIIHGPAGRIIPRLRSCPSQVHEVRPPPPHSFRRRLRE